MLFLFAFFVFKQKTAYEMRISDWSSDVCSSDLVNITTRTGVTGQLLVWGAHGPTIIRVRPGRRFLAMPLQVGSVVPTITSSAGRVFLAYLPEQVATDAARDEWRDAARQPANGWKALYSKCRNGEIGRAHV